MAKNVDFKIKIDGKQIDLTKISFKQFDDIVKEAKKNLQSLPLTDPRYKQLVGDIKTAEKAWKEATKSAADFNDENEKGAEQVKSYKTQIRETTVELQAVEQQFGKNSEEAQKLRDRLVQLRDEQDDFNETTRKLDDSLSAIPGPIGKVGQAMQQVGFITNNAKSAFAQLSKQFPILDTAWKAIGIGLLVTLILGLVSAVVKAAKSFKPLQDAFAGLQDAFGAVMSALKPFTDFVLNVVVGAMNMLANAITFVAEAFGGVSSGAAKATLDLEREIAKQERTIGRLGDTLGDYTKNVLNAFAEQKKAILDINQALKDGTITLEQQKEQELLILLNYNTKLKQIENDYQKLRAEKMGEVEVMRQKADAASIDNARKSQLELQRIDLSYSEFQLTNDVISYKARRKALVDNLNVIKKLNIEGQAEIIKALESSIEEQDFLIKNAQDRFKAIDAQGNNEKLKLQREFNREDTRLINERALSIQQLTTQLIKEENFRNLQAAKDSLGALKEQHRVELEEARLAGVSLKNLREKQAAEVKLANETVRKEQLQYDAFLIQLEIDKQQRLVTEAGIGTKEYFDARAEIINKEFEKELLLADGNQSKVEDARTKHWKAILELDKEGLEAQINQIQLEYNGLYDGTVSFFAKQRELEVKNFELQQKIYQGNYDALEALNKEHKKKMALIDAAEIQNRADLEMRKFAAIGTMRQSFFDEAYKSENDFYQAERLRAGENNELLEVIELEHLKRTKEIDAQRIEARNQVYAAIAQITQEFGNLLGDIAQQQLEAAQGTDEKRFESAKKFAKAAVIVERLGAIGQIVANTGIANAKAVAASPLTFGQPWVTINSISAGVSIAAIIASAIKSINDINSQKFEPESGQRSGMGRGLEKGGLIKGKRHAQGGTMIEAEDGEAVMTRGAVTMFAPLLSMINQAGGGTSFNTPHMMVTLPDNPNVANPAQNQQPIIMKTYVVENELTSTQQKQARLKDLSTL